MYTQIERKEGLSMDITGALNETMTEAFKNNGGRSTLIAIPLALAPRAARSFAQSHQFCLKTAEEILCDEYREENTEERGCLSYEYFPTLLCQQIRGSYTAERFYTCLPRLQRFLCSGHRKRPHLYTQVSRWLGVPATLLQDEDRAMIA
jgi:hypothetical protein